MDPARRRIKPVIRLLRKHYPQARTALEFAGPLQILVATILAAQCTDERVNTITPGLFRKYPDAAALALADRAELEVIIRPTGFFRNKARHIIGAAQKIVAELKDKMGKFALIKERTVPLPPAAPALRDEVCDILLQLGYSIKEAENMVDAASAANPEIKSAEALVQAIYKQKHSS